MQDAQNLASEAHVGVRRSDEVQHNPAPGGSGGPFMKPLLLSHA